MRRVALPVLCCSWLRGRRLWRLERSAEVGAGYVAKEVCSCMFVGGRSLESCRSDVPESMDRVRAEALPDGVRGFVPGLASRVARHEPASAARCTELFEESPMRFPELGIYLLPGHTDSPGDVIREVQEAEALGLGSAWISERFDVKEVGALCGAAVAVTKEIWVGTGVTNVDTRHPLVLATLATTLWRLSGGRFALGVGRGIGVRAGMMGLTPVKNAQLTAFAELMRKLWKGERVMGHDSGLGKYPYLHQAAWLDEPIPLLMTAFGPGSLEYAGSVFDGEILHTFMIDEAGARARALVNRGARRAGRYPARLKLGACSQWPATPPRSACSS